MGSIQEVKNIEVVPVDSSNANYVGYNPKKKLLYVEFRGGALYRYSGVPKVIFEGLQQTDSFGRYLNQKVKGKYDFVKV